MLCPIDISETRLLERCPEVLTALLRDHTTGSNIFWATDSYAYRGEGYRYEEAITAERITGENGLVIRPRILKEKEEQTERTKGMAEVFTPSWICNEQNNLVDEAWFGRKGVFNTPDERLRTWSPNPEKITFPEGKSWKDYVRSVRLEITCGEAPYLTSRYDTTTGETIPLEKRIGLVDRKLRVVSENTDNSREWLQWAQAAFKSCYGYEWQGDNLLLARENLLMSFVDYFQEKFGRMPRLKSLRYIAYIVSWNVWQMDGLKGVVPGSCKEVRVDDQDLFGPIERIKPCTGCQTGTLEGHNGTYCLIRDWGRRDPKTKENNRKIRFIDLVK
ncbi:MAG: restriction endonuclease subunit M [Porphyromonadaceae bacterium]|nr:restriction endonuclease subunit M [Porphyromonadaceae bacterium]